MIQFPNLNSFLRIRTILPKILIFLNLSALLLSCAEEPSFLGRDLLPPNDDVTLKVDTISLLQAYTAEAKPIITVNNATYLLGSINDPVFGYSESEIVSQIGIVSSRKFNLSMEVDSLIVNLKLSGYYGDSLSIQTVKIYEMTDDIKTDSSYFSNASVAGQHSPIEIGSADFMAKDTLIRVNIHNQNFIYKFLTSHDSVFQNNASFINAFKGFYFAIEPKTESGGAMVDVNFSSIDSRMVLYYDSIQNDTANLAYAMFFAGELNAFNIFRNTYDNYPPAANLNNPDSQDTVLFLTSMAGLNVHIRLPELERWKEMGPISIIKAELIIGIEDSVYQWNNSKLFPQNVFLFYLNQQGNYSYLSDYSINQQGFGGGYLSSEKVYKFNIGHYLQSYIAGKTENVELVLIPEKSNNTANRVLIKSPLAQSQKRMKLRVIYTQL